jgi:lysophospholipase L1-like esterase
MRTTIALFLATFLLASPAWSADLTVKVYHDTDTSSFTDLEQAMDEDDLPLTGVELTLFGAGSIDSATTDDQGTAVFADLADGAWLVMPATPDEAWSTSRNTPTRIFDVITEEDGDGLVYVALGDSTPVEGTEEDRPYPTRLQELLEPLFSDGVTLHNDAEPGSKSFEWLEGSELLTAATPHLEAADLVTLTIGGNDLVDAIESGDMGAMLAAVETTFTNIGVIVGEIRAINATADVVVTIYPNYLKADHWDEGGDPESLAFTREAVDGIIATMRAVVAKIDGVIIADMGALMRDADMNLYMYDKLHVNDVGHQLYADVIFRALGGALLPEDAEVGKLFGYAFPEEPVVEEDRPEPDVVDDDTAGSDATGTDATIGTDGAGAGGSSADDGDSSGCSHGRAPATPAALALVLLAVLGLGARRAWA